MAELKIWRLRYAGQLLPELIKQAYSYSCSLLMRWAVMRAGEGRATEAGGREWRSTGLSQVSAPALTVTTQTSIAKLPWPGLSTGSGMSGSEDLESIQDILLIASKKLTCQSLQLQYLLGSLH